MCRACFSALKYYTVNVSTMLDMSHVCVYLVGRHRSRHTGSNGRLHLYRQTQSRCCSILCPRRSRKFSSHASCIVFFDSRSQTRLRLNMHPVFGGCGNLLTEEFLKSAGKLPLQFSQKVSREWRHFFWKYYTNFQLVVIKLNVCIS